MSKKETLVAMPDFHLVSNMRVVVKTLVLQCCLLAGLLLLFAGSQWLYGIFDQTRFASAVTMPAGAERLEEKEKGALLADAITNGMRRELASRFGWSFNDILFNRFLLDNRAYRQYGVFHATKTLMEFYSVNMGKLGSNDRENPELYQARMNGFVMDPRSFMFPSAESAYEKALNLVDQYKAGLSGGTARFNCRSDDVHGAISLIVGQQLMGYAMGLLENAAHEPFYALDNRIYEVQGIILVVRDFLAALGALYPDILKAREDLAAAMRYMDFICTYDPLYITSSFNCGEVILANLTFARSRLEDIRASIRM